MENIILHSYSPTSEEKKYCKRVLAEIEDQIPSRYASLVQLRLKQAGINLDTEYIYLVRIGRKYNRLVVDTLKDITRPARTPKKVKDIKKYLLSHIR